MKQLRGRVAAITGAGSGIGRALALELAHEGCHLALSDINPESLADTAGLLPDNVTVTTTVLDVADRQAWIEWAQAVVDSHGQVHLIINNAGVALSAPAETTPLTDFRWVMDINFWGVVYGTQAFLPYLRASGRDHVVNISSLFGLIGVPTQAAYCAAKFAVRGFTESLRMELDIERDGVSATCVHPGGVATAIARSGKVAVDVEKLTGKTPERMRRMSERMIQTTSPTAAARAIIAGVKKDARRVVIGPDARMLDKIARLLGAGYQWMITRRMRTAAGWSKPERERVHE